MNELVKNVEQVIESNIQEINLLKQKKESLFNELADTHVRILNMESINKVLEKELVDYVNSFTKQDLYNCKSIDRPITDRGDRPIINR